MASVTIADLTNTFEKLSEFMTKNHLVSPGFTLVLQRGSKTNGVAWRIYETPADPSDGSGLFVPMVGSDYLGTTRVEAERVLRERLDVLSAAFNPARFPNVIG